MILMISVWPYAWEKKTKKNSLVLLAQLSRNEVEDHSVDNFQTTE